jgi:hypothetical protein
LLRELPERDNCAEKEKRIKNGFEHTATFLVGAHEKGVGRFVFAVHKVCQFDNLSCATFISARTIPIPSNEFLAAVSILKILTEHGTSPRCDRPKNFG